MLIPKPGIFGGHCRGRNVQVFGTDGRRGNCFGRLNRVSVRKTSTCHALRCCEDMILPGMLILFWPDVRWLNEKKNHSPPSPASPATARDQQGRDRSASDLSSCFMSFTNPTPRDRLPASTDSHTHLCYCPFSSLMAKTLRVEQKLLSFCCVHKHVHCIGYYLCMKRRLGRRRTVGQKKSIRMNSALGTMKTLLVLSLLYFSWFSLPVHVLFS